MNNLKPIFIVGPGRSGTTILQRYIGTFRNCILYKAEIPLSGFYLNYINLLRRNLQTNKKYILENLRLSEKKILKIEKKRFFTVGELMPHLFLYFYRFKAFGLSALKQLLYKKQYLCTNLVFDGYSFNLDDIKFIFPDCKIIYIHRNIEEILISKSSFTGFSHKDIATNYEETISLQEKLLESVKDDLIEIILYKDIKSNPVKVNSKLEKALSSKSIYEPENFFKNNRVHPASKPNEAKEKVIEFLNKPLVRTRIENLKKTFSQLI